MSILHKRLGFRLLLQMNYAFVVTWQDLATFQAFIASANGKESKVRNFQMNILTTKSKWVVDIFLSLLFINPKLKKHLSSLTLPKTMALDNSISFCHSINGKEVGCWTRWFTFLCMDYNPQGVHGYMAVGKHSKLEKK